MTLECSRAGINCPMPPEDESALETALRVFDSIRGSFGYAIMVCVTVAFLVLGNLAGRLIGAALLVACLGIAASVIMLRRRSGTSPDGRMDE
jgi:hypothetical protein